MGQKSSCQHLESVAGRKSVWQYQSGSYSCLNGLAPNLIRPCSGLTIFLFLPPIVLPARMPYPDSDDDDDIIVLPPDTSKAIYAQVSA